MILKRFYDDTLAQASFLIGCAKTGEAAVIDGNRDVDQYIKAAAIEGLAITTVTETHIHADYVSGSRELAKQTGARLFLSDEGTADWKYQFADQPNVTLVRDGDSIRIGNVRLDVMATPGHTPEHIAFVLTDEPAGSGPLGVFTGDFIFVGDVGRPDLLERAAGFEGTMQAGAKTLFRSLQRFKKLDDNLILWPAHGSGSACGKSLGGVPISTLGYEKKANWGLRCATEDEFVKVVLEGQPEPPVYFKEMKRINRDGPSILGGQTIPGRLGGNMIFELLERDQIIIDIRSIGDTATGFIPGTYNIAYGKPFLNWSGWLIPYDKPIYLIANSQYAVMSATNDLAKIGLDDVRGWLGSDALRAYENRFGALEIVKQISVCDAAEQVRTGASTALDVRGLAEYAEGHVPNSIHIPLGFLSSRSSNLSKDAKLIVHCQAGTRSAIAISVLRKMGYTDVTNMPGGFSEYSASKLPIEIATETTAA